ncbi:X-Pro aminopeptidase [Vibrio sp. UCD-FRSSP16_10]|uniref:aminopeptidase P family protein n=1 Tax=unclassified Vibrio TaxID=2614977 RepID=UPI0007FF38EA|nr:MULTISPECIES: aminopeptidase P family protein [unclassified Vibrio]OBT12902.1 X-Pro aminopeptidase [Vibrio sp. UCD-FRSSP16_30]OBT18365.1 X-Pro aminopeptidase [Vibrio sp. UCD-FRSSP16_10]
MSAEIKSCVTGFRNWLKKEGLDAFIVPHEDEFLGEYIPAHNERLHWLTGFTGSAGAAIVSTEEAAIFVDGRYTVQVTKQTPADVFAYQHLIETPPIVWIQQNLKHGSKIGIDPKMHSGRWLKAAINALADDYELVYVEHNPVDILWSNRPDVALSTLRLMENKWVGIDSQEKRTLIADILKQQKADSAVLTALDSICWLLNIRGSDISRLPVALSHAIIHSNSDVEFFIDSDRVPSNFQQHVGAGVSLFTPSQLKARLATLKGSKVILDPATSNAWFGLTLNQQGAEVLAIADPCLLPKATKNSTEALGMKNCHVRDGVAMVKFLTWFDKKNSQSEFLNEAQLADQLEAFRREDSSLADLSFDTISAAAHNAAMCHYNHENEPTPGVVANNSMYLVDSGGQYPDGTTDITRTVAIGQPTEAMKKQFTLVLKGHIGIAQARFPKGTCGHQIDILARQHLWANGFDYDHGTGHGVGHFLSVHEGPQRIGKGYSDVALEAGMVISNEPGYYRTDEFGIRIENLEIVVEIETEGDFSVLGFESLTRCPIDKRNIELSLLAEHEVKWLNNYHQTVWNELSPLVDGDEKQWLENATSAI